MVTSTDAEQEFVTFVAPCRHKANTLRTMNNYSEITYGLECVDLVYYEKTHAFNRMGFIFGICEDLKVLSELPAMFSYKLHGPFSPL